MVSYQNRIKQKHFILKLGNIGLPLSIVLAFIGFVFFDKLYFLISAGLSLLYLSGSFALVFSRIGWSRNILIDLIFNQLSIVITILGHFLGFLFVQYSLPFSNVGFFLIIISFLMAGIGIKLQSTDES